MDPDTLESLQACFARHPEVRVALVFGSVAAGRTTRESDIDVAVSTGRPLDVEQRITLMEDIAVATGRPVDLVDLHTAGYLVMREALSNGVYVVRGDAEDRNRVVMRMLFEEADFMPYYRRIVAGQLERARREP